MIYPRVALSIRQPWAHRILNEGKNCENRDWLTKFRGLVLIHAGKKYDDGYTEDDFLMQPPRGGIVGMVEITDCVTTMDSEWFCGPYGFVLRNPVALEFVPCRGKLGFFNPDIDFSALKPL